MQCITGKDHCCSSDLRRGQGFHADPLGRAFLKVPGVQPVLFYLLDPRNLPHPARGNKCCESMKNIAQFRILRLLCGAKSTVPLMYNFNISELKLLIFY